MNGLNNMEQNLILDISKIVKKLLIQDIFYGLFLSGIPKHEVPEKQRDKNHPGYIPLAAVGLNKATMEFSLIINPDEWFKLSNEVKFGVLLHEAKHLCMFHLLTGDMFSNARLDNVACDIEINQTIDKAYLPSWGCFYEDFKDKYPELTWKANAGRKYYYDELSKLSEEKKEQMGISEKAQHVWIITDGDGNAVDPNSLTEAEKNAIRVQMESTLETLAEEVQKSNGHIPSEINQLISGFVKPKPKFNYQQYIRNYIGNSTKYFIGTSKLRENQRFPGQPKVVLKPLNRTLVLIDESGSVSKTELDDFLNEIHHMSKKVDIEIRPFDTEVMEPVKYNGKGTFKRTNCGGTSFTAAVDYYNQDKKFNSCIIFTDGHAETPPKCFKKILWVISSNGNEEPIKDHATWIKIPK